MSMQRARPSRNVVLLGGGLLVLAGVAWLLLRSDGAMVAPPDQDLQRTGGAHASATPELDSRATALPTQSISTPAKVTINFVTFRSESVRGNLTFAFRYAEPEFEGVGTAIEGRAEIERASEFSATDLYVHSLRLEGRDVGWGLLLAHPTAEEGVFAVQIPDVSSSRIRIVASVSRAPIEGAALYWAAEAGLAGGASWYEGSEELLQPIVTSGPSGVVGLPRDFERRDIWIVRAGFAALHLSRSDISSDTSEPTDVALQVAGAVQVSISGDSGETLHATLWYDTNSPSLTLPIGGEFGGRVRFSPLPSGKYRVRVSRAGSGPVEDLVVAVRSGETTTVNVIVPPKVMVRIEKVEFLLTGATLGMDQEHVEAELTGPLGLGAEVSTSVSGSREDGALKFSARDLFPGRYALTLAGSSRVDIFDITTTSYMRTTAWEAGASLGVSVRDADSRKPIVAALIRYRTTACDAALGESAQSSAECEGLSAYIGEGWGEAVQAGEKHPADIIAYVGKRLELVCSATGYVTKRMELRPLAGAGHEVEVLLIRGGAMAFSIPVSGGAPVGDVDVLVEGPAESDAPRAYTVQVRQATGQSNTLAPGIYSVRAVIHGKPIERKVRVDPGVTAAVDLGE